MRKITLGWMLVAIAICVGLILIGIYPYRPNGLIGWIVLFLIAVPIVLSLEFIGRNALENKFVANMGRTSRIIYGTITVLFIIVLILVGWKLAKPYLGTW